MFSLKKNSGKKNARVSPFLRTCTVSSPVVSEAVADTPERISAQGIRTPRKQEPREARANPPQKPLGQTHLPSASISSSCSKINQVPTPLSIKLEHVGTIHFTSQLVSFSVRYVSRSAMQCHLLLN